MQHVVVEPPPITPRPTAKAANWCAAVPTGQDAGGYILLPWDGCYLPSSCKRSRSAFIRCTVKCVAVVSAVAVTLAHSKIDTSTQTKTHVCSHEHTNEYIRI